MERNQGQNSRRRSSRTIRGQRVQPLDLSELSAQTSQSSSGRLGLQGIPSTGTGGPPRQTRDSLNTPFQRPVNSAMGSAAQGLRRIPSTGMGGPPRQTRGSLNTPSRRPVSSAMGSAAQGFDVEPIDSISPDPYTDPMMQRFRGAYRDDPDRELSRVIEGSELRVKGILQERARRTTPFTGDRFYQAENKTAMPYYQPKTPWKLRRQLTPPDLPPFSNIDNHWRKMNEQRNSQRKNWSDMSHRKVFKKSKYKMDSTNQSASKKELASRRRAIFGPTYKPPPLILPRIPIVTDNLGSSLPDTIEEGDESSSGSYRTALSSPYSGSSMGSPQRSRYRRTDAGYDSSRSSLSSPERVASGSSNVPRSSPIPIPSRRGSSQRPRARSPWRRSSGYPHVDKPEDTDDDSEWED